MWNRKRALVTAGVAVGALIAIHSSTATTGVHYEAQLRLARAPVQFDAAAASDTAVVGVGFGSGGANTYVFSRWAGGWRSQADAAVLRDPGGTQANYPQISSGAIVVEESLGPYRSRIDLFVRPASGWHDQASPTATLTSSRSRSVVSPVASGAIVAATAIGPSGGHRSAVVFDRPAGGWSGKIEPAATLVDPKSSQDLRVVGASASYVFAATSATVDVFKRPKYGWRGHVRPVARLGPRHPIASATVTGSGVLAGGELFIEPRRGWLGNVPATTTAFVLPRTKRAALVTNAVGPGAVAFGSSSVGGEHQCPCTGRIWLATKPGTGWRKTEHLYGAASFTTSDGPPALAIASQTLFATTGPAIDVYRLIRAR